MANVQAQISVTTSAIPSLGNGGEPQYTHHADSSLGTLSIYWYPGSPRRTFLCWRITVTAGYGSGDVTQVHPEAPSFTTKSETVIFSYPESEQAQVFYIDAVAVFDDGSYTPQPGDPYKTVAVTAVNGSTPASGTVTVNGNTSTTSASASGLAATDGTTGFSYTVSATPSDGYEFDHWNDELAIPSRSGVAYSDTTFTAYFKKLRSVKVLRWTIGGSEQAVEINASIYYGLGNYDPGDTVNVRCNVPSGLTTFDRYKIVFRAARLDSTAEPPDLSNATVIADNSAEGAAGATGGRTLTFTMPDADVLVVAVFMYSKVRIIPVVYTDGVQNGTGGSCTPSSAYKADGDSVSFTASPSSGYKPGRTSDVGSYVWDWSAAPSFDLGGAQTRQSGSQTSATVKGDAAEKLSTLPSWTGLNSLADTWFTQSDISAPELYFHTEEDAYFVKVTLETYASHGQAIPQSADGVWVKVQRSSYAHGVGAMIPVSSMSQFLVAGLVREDEDGTRTVLYRYAGGLNVRVNVTDAIQPEDQTGEVKYHYHAWIWPKTTNKILYRQSDGAILCGPDGSPMAQFVDVQQQGA